MLVGVCLENKDARQRILWSVGRNQMQIIFEFLLAVLPQKRHTFCVEEFRNLAERKIIRRLQESRIQLLECQIALHIRLRLRFVERSREFCDIDRLQNANIFLVVVL